MSRTRKSVENIKRGNWLWMKSLPVVLLLLMGFSLHAQEEREYTWPKMYDVRWHNLTWPLQSHGIDTSLAEFHLYDPVFGEMPPRRYLGTFGQPSLMLVWQPKDTRYFNPGWRQYRRQVREWEDIRFYDQDFPLTDLNYVQGSKGEQRFNVTHYRNLGPHVKVGIDYLIHKSNGFYANQQASLENFNFYLQYESPNNRYGAIAGYFSDNIDNGRNGGLDTAALSDNDITLSDAFGYGRKQFLPVLLDEASSDYNRKTGFVRQHLEITKPLPDSLENIDTIQRGVFQLFHEAAYNYGRYVYADPSIDTGYYETILLRRDSTKDVTTWRSFRNSVGINGIIQSKSASMSGSASANWEPLIVRQQGRAYYYNQTYLQGRWRGSLGQDRLEIQATGVLHLTGYKGGDWTLTGKGHFELSDWFKLIAAIQVDRSQPDFIYQHYLSNHAYWEQSFNPVSQRSLMAGIAIPKLQTEVRIRPFNIGNYLYFDVDQQVAQSTSVTGLVAEWEQRVNVGFLHLRQYLAFQQIDASAPIHLPKLVTSHSLYGAFEVFQKVLLLHVGLEVSYNSPYAADHFDPVLGQFYLNDGGTIASYPVADVFVSGMIHGARVFLMMTHVNQGLFGDGGMYSTPSFPIPDRSFKFGVSWRFFD